MQPRRLGKTGLKVGVIGFGGIKLPGIHQDTAKEVRTGLPGFDTPLL